MYPRYSSCTNFTKELFSTIGKRQGQACEANDRPRPNPTKNKVNGASWWVRDSITTVLPFLSQNLQIHLRIIKLAHLRTFLTLSGYQILFLRFSKHMYEAR